MTAEDDLLRELDQSPDDIDLRLAYADWLEEHDDPRGAMIRIEEEMRSLPIHADRYWQLKPMRHAYLDYCDEKFFDQWLVRMGYHRRYEPAFRDLSHHPAHRWRLFREFIERWHGIRLLDDHAELNSLDGFRQTLGRQLSHSIQQWHQLSEDLGNEFTKVFRDRVMIENLVRHEAVSLMLLSEGDVYWAVGYEHLDAEDPPVSTYSLYHDQGTERFSYTGQPHRSVTSFALSHASYFLGRGVSYAIDPADLRDLAMQHDQPPVTMGELCIYEAENVIVVFDGQHIRLSIWGSTPVESLPTFFQALMSNR